MLGPARTEIGDSFYFLIIEICFVTFGTNLECCKCGAFSNFKGFKTVPLFFDYFQRKTKLGRIQQTVVYRQKIRGQVPATLGSRQSSLISRHQGNFLRNGDVEGICYSDKLMWMYVQRYPHQHPL